jgi:Fe(3+) dicitrate transport protein
MVTGSGAILDAYHKESDGARDNMHSRLDDLNFKWAGQLNEDNKLILRATHFREYSQLTYSGLTQAEYVNLGPRYNPFKNDFFDANRTGLSATHELKLNADAKVLTSIYGAYFDRDWWRQASTTTDCQLITRTAGNALSASDIQGCQVDGRLRAYTTLGLDSRVTQSHSLLGLANQLEYGVKVHAEIQDRKQLRYQNYTKYLNGDTTGVTHIQEDQQRKTQAISAFIMNRFEVTNQLAVTPIIRIENIHHQRTLRQTSIATTNEVSFTELIPGLSATFALDKNSIIYGGIHKGFSPPRVEDALRSTSNSSTTASVQSVDLNAERSVNAEIGLRSSLSQNTSVDVTVFRNDFSNLVQVGSIAGGSISYAEGKALFQGAESAIQFDQLSKAVPGNLFLKMSLTHLMVAEQRTQFNVVSPHTGGPYGAVGNRLPYAPKNLATISLGYRATQNWNGRIEYVYVGSQYSDFGNTTTPSSDGQTGLIDAYGIWNVVANYTIGSATLFVTAKNLTDQTYIVDRTRGIQVGMPRTVQAGIKYAF